MSLSFRTMLNPKTHTHEVCSGCTLLVLQQIRSNPFTPKVAKAKNLPDFIS